MISLMAQKALVPTMLIGFPVPARYRMKACTFLVSSFETGKVLAGQHRTDTLDLDLVADNFL